MFSAFFLIISCVFVNFFTCFGGKTPVYKCNPKLGLRNPIGIIGCEAYFESYFYHPKTGQCIFKEYSGCSPSIYGFQTEEECKKECEGYPCNAPFDKGPCKALGYRYGYNKTSGQCERFEYGGCGGNANNFKLEEDCENRCGDVCNQTPFDSGNCLASFERYSYNKERGQCEKFTYGGCGGNGNNFETENECKDECLKVVEE